MKKVPIKNLAKSKDFGHEESVGFALSSGAICQDGRMGGHKFFYFK